jgi:hypothetical protein
MARAQGLSVGGLDVSGASNSLGGNAFARTAQEYSLGGSPKVGAGAGWVVNAAADLFQATCPASQTAATLVVPIFGLKVGWTITGFRVVMQIESAGGTVTVDAALRAQTNVAADPTDALIGAGMTQASVTADTALSGTKTGLTEVVVSTKSYYLLITVTTGSSCDIRYLGSWISVTEA